MVNIECYRDFFSWKGIKDVCEVVEFIEWDFCSFDIKMIYVGFVLNFNDINSEVKC